jgi:glycosyltransferase involved in cell wall biosynthesis
MRDESAVIGRCLTSAQETLGNQLAGVVLADTGSTDDTIAVARNAYPTAVIVQHDWHDFATNRNMLLDVAYEQGTEWVLMLDPDMTLEGQLPDIEGLGYEVDILGVGNSCFTNPRLLSTQRQWRYEGVVHEALADYPGLPRLEGLRIRHHGSTDHTHDGRFEQDRAALQGTINTRNLFYLAQTERNLGNTDKAVSLYELRASLGGWPEEVYYALYQAAMLKGSVEGLLKAWESRPQRGEALYHLLGLLRGRESWQTAHVLSLIGQTLTVPPEDVLWVEPWMYEWGLKFEHSITCFWVGKYAECVALSEWVAEHYDVPLNYRQQAIRNRDLARQHLPAVETEPSPTPPVAILVPILNRPHKIAECVRNIEDNTPEPHRIVFGVSETDEASKAVLDESGLEYLTIPEPGTYARKINTLYKATVEPYVFLAADDYRFTPGWLTNALRGMRDVEGVVAVDDLCNNLGTCCLVSRKYIEEQGGTADTPSMIFHDGYRHNFCDMELYETAKSRGRYRWCGDSIVEHQHHIVGKSAHDPTYALGDSSYAQDEALYVSRQHLWTQ